MATWPPGLKGQPKEMARKKPTSPFVWQALNTASVLLINVAYITAMARLIDKEVHGVFAILNAILMFSMFISESGVGAAIIQRRNYNSAHLSAALYMSLILSAVLSLIIFFFSDPLAKFYQYRFSALLVQAISINVMIGAFRIIPICLLTRELEFSKLLIVTISGRLFGRVVTGITLACLGFGIWAFVIAEIAASALMAVIANLMRPYSFKFNPKLKEMREIAGFGVTYTLVRLMSFATAQTDKLILGKLIPASNLAIFEKAQFATNLPRKMIGDAITPVLFPLMSKHQSNPEHLRQQFINFQALALTIGLYSLCLIESLNARLLSFVLGSQWQECEDVIAVFAIGIPLYIVIRFSDVATRVKNSMGYSIGLKALFVAGLALALRYSYQQDLATIATFLLAILTIYAFLMFVLANRLLGSSMTDAVQPLWQARYFIACCAVKALTFNLWISKSTEFDLFAITAAVAADLLLFLIVWNSPFRDNFFGRSNVSTVRVFFGATLRI